MAITVGQPLVWSTALDNSGLVRGAKQGIAILTKFSKNVTALDVFAGIGISAAVAFTAASISATKFEKEFEQAMAEVATISNDVADNIDVISQKLFDLSQTIPESSVGLARAFYQTISAGVTDTGEALIVLEQSAKAATAGLTDAFTGVDAITTILNSYGDAISGAEEASDLFFTTVRLGKTTFPELAQGIGTVSGIAAQAGLRVDELFATIATATKTLRTDIAFTGLRGILNAIAQGVQEDGQEIVEQLNEIGIEFSAAGLQAVGFQRFMEGVLQVTGGTLDEMRKLFGNIRGLTGILAIAKDGGEDYVRSLEEMRTSVGATSAAFEIMVVTTENQLKILSNNLKRFIRPLGEFFLGEINDIVSSINKLFEEARSELGQTVDFFEQFNNILVSRRNRIQQYVNTIEDLSKKSKLTAEETSALVTAQKQLAVIIPGVSSAWDDETTAVQNLAKANQVLLGTNDQILEQSIKIAELNREIAKIQLKTAENRQKEQSDRLADFKKSIQEERNEIGKVILDAAKNKGIIEGFSLIGEATENFTKRQKQQIQELSDAFEQGEINSSKLRVEADRLAKEFIDSSPKFNEAQKDIELGFLNSEKAVLELSSRIQIATARINGLKKGAEDLGKVSIVPSDIVEEIFTPQEIFDDIKDKFKIFATLFKDIELLPPGLLDEVFGEVFNEDVALERLEIIKNAIQGGGEEFAELAREVNLAILDVERFRIARQKELDDERQKELDKQQQIQEDYLNAIQDRYTRERRLINEEFDKLEEDFKGHTDELENLSIARRDALAGVDIREATEKFRKELALINETIAKADPTEDQRKRAIRSLVLLADKYKDFGDIVKDINKEIAKLLKDLEDAQTSTIAKLVQGFSELSILVGAFNSEIGDTISQFADLAQTIESFKAGDTSILGLAGVGISAFKTVIGLFQGETISFLEKVNRSIEESANRLAELERNITLALGADRLRLSQQLIQEKEAEIDRLNKEIDRILDRRVLFQGRLLFQEGDVEVFQRLKDEIKELEFEIEESMNNIRDSIIGQTDESIADLLANQFADGLTETQDFVDSFEDIIKRGILEVFKSRILNEQLDAFLDAFADALTPEEFQGPVLPGQELPLGTLGLTEEELARLKAQFDELIAGTQEQWDALIAALGETGAAIFGIPGAEPEGISGAIAGITERTAGVIEGLLTADRITNIESLARLEDISLDISEIAANTRYNRLLEPILAALTVVGTDPGDVSKAQGG